MKVHHWTAHLAALSLVLLVTTTAEARTARKRAIPPHWTFISLPPPSQVEGALQPEAIVMHPDLARNAAAAIRLMEALDVSPNFQ